MKKILLVSTALCAGQYLFAQIPEDAIRMSWNQLSGTARTQAIGGASGSIGGDISSLYSNPAGIGFYKRGEFVVSPRINLLGGSGKYLGTSTDYETATKFGLGTTGFVWGSSNPNSRWASSFSMAFNRSANFSSRVSYGGENDFSSLSESFAEDFAQSGLPIAVPLYSAPVAFGTKLAAYTFLIDTLSVNGGTEVVGLPQRDAILAGTEARLGQRKDVITKGGISELAFGYAGNFEDRIYIGGSLGIPIVNYERTSTFTENDLSGNPDNNFNQFEYRENYSSSGIGFNAKIGIIVKASEQFRAGLAINSPTIYALREKTTGRMESDVENYRTNGEIGVADANTIYTDNNADIPEYRYDLVAPWKFLVSGTYLFGNGFEDVKKQKGFITADLEYVTHRSSRFSPADPEDDPEYYDGVNDAIKLSYKNALNARVGGELKFNTFAARLGFAYYGSPYEEKEFEAKRMFASGGIGYRNWGMFADLTYVQSLSQDVDFPYRLADNANTYAALKDRTGTVLLTLGFKF